MRLHLAKTYYKELILSGGQIYEYTPGFAHAKVFVSEMIRQLWVPLIWISEVHLHFECGTFIYNNPVVSEVEKDFQATLKKMSESDDG